MISHNYIYIIWYELLYIKNIYALLCTKIILLAIL